MTFFAPQRQCLCRKISLMRVLSCCVIATFGLIGCKSPTDSQSTTFSPASTETSQSGSTTSTKSPESSTWSTSLTPGPDKGNTILLTALAEAKKVTTQSDAALQNAYDPIANSLILAKRGGRDMIWYSGLDTDVAAFNSFMKSTLAEAGVDTNCMWLMDYLVVRPTWFYMAKSSTQVMRDCTIVLVEWSDKSVSSGPIIDGMKKFLSVVYSPVIELLVRSNDPVPSDTKNFSFFRQTIVALTGSADGVRGQITSSIQSATPDAWLASLNDQDRAFMQRLIDSNFSHPSLSYLVDFMDANGLPLYVVKVILNQLTDFDNEELSHTINDMRTDGSDWPSVSCISSDGGGINQNYGCWFYATGGFFSSIYTTNKPFADKLNVYKNCLTDAFFQSSQQPSIDDLFVHDIYYYLKDVSSSTAITMYKCFADALVEGTLSLATDLTDDVNSQHIVYLYRMISSVSAFLAISGN